MSLPFRIRLFVPQDLASVVETWNRSAGQPRRAVYYPLTERKVRTVWMERPDFDPQGFFVAEDEQGLAGGIMVNSRLNKSECGQLEAVFTRTGRLHVPMAQALMDHALTYLSSTGLKKVATTSHSNPDSRDIEMLDFLWLNRFVASAVYDWLIDQNIAPLGTLLGRTLDDFTIPEWIVAVQREAEREGYAFKSYSTDKNRVPVEAFGEFPFVPTFKKTIQTNSPLEHLFLAWRGDRIVGGMMVSLPYAPTEWPVYGCDGGLFGPAGVTRELRGKGVGKVLLFQSVDRLRELKCHDALVPTGSTTYPFYAKAGFSIVRISVGMQRPLGNIHVHFKEIA